MRRGIWFPIHWHSLSVVDDKRETIDSLRDRLNLFQIDRFSNFFQQLSQPRHIVWRNMTSRADFQRKIHQYPLACMSILTNGAYLFDLYSCALTTFILKAIQE